MAVMQPLRALRAVKPAGSGGTPPLSAERVALADAIAAHVDLQARQAATSAAIRTATEATWDARRRLDAAPELVERAKVNVAQHLADMARGVGGTPPQTIREARDAVRDAEDDLDVAKASHDALQAEMGRLDERAYFVKSAVEVAARAVISAEAADTARAMAAELTRLQHQVYTTGLALEWLTTTGRALPVIERHGGMFGRVVDDAIRDTVQCLHEPPVAWGRRVHGMSDGAAPWVAAFAALQLDATAPLPLVPAP